MASDPSVMIETTGQGVLSVRSDLTFATVNTVLGHSKTLLQSGTDEIVIDLAQVERADSAGLALLLEWLRITRASNRSLHFRHVPEQLLAIARASDMERLIPLES